MAFAVKKRDDFFTMHGMQRDSRYGVRLPIFRTPEAITGKTKALIVTDRSLNRSNLDANGIRNLKPREP